MLFKKNKLENLQEQPPEYWEEKSVFVILIESDKGIFNNITNKIEEIENLKIKEQKFETDRGTLKLTVTYNNEEYEIGFFLSPFEVHKYFLNNTIDYTKTELETLKNIKMGLVLYMEFGTNPKNAYHLELKLASTISPTSIAVFDESSEKLIPMKWIKLASKTDILPSGIDLFSVQIVNNKNGKTWLHTHGLSRCHLRELEILDSNKELSFIHYKLITSLGTTLIDNPKSLLDKCIYIGETSNNDPVIVTTIPWTEALKEYDKLSIGGIEDRINGHNTQSDVIFLYTPNDKNYKLNKLSTYDSLWGNNPIFFLTTEETNRMSALAKERYNYLSLALDKGYEVQIKIGIKTTDNKSTEHIWHKLCSIKGNTFKCTLLQEPFDIKNLKVGETYTYKKEEITDFIIFTKKVTITPSTVYLLEKENLD